MMGRLLGRGASRLVLNVSDSSFAMTSLDEITRTVELDGKKLESQLPSGEKVELQSKWDKDKIVVSTKVEGGQQIHETWKIDKDRLVLEVSISSSRMGRIKVKRIYDRAES